MIELITAIALLCGPQYGAPSNTPGANLGQSANAKECQVKLMKCVNGKKEHAFTALGLCVAEGK